MIAAVVSISWVLVCGIYNALKPSIPNKMIVAGIVLTTIFRIKDWIKNGFAFRDIFIAWIQVSSATDYS